MKELSESIINVVSGSNFLLYIGMIVAFGISIGGSMNHGFTGFTKSFKLVTPLFIVYFISSLNRVIDYTKVYGVGSQSFNNLVSIVIITVVYMIGLIIGHIVVNNRVKNVMLKHGIKHRDIPKTLKKIEILKKSGL